jgi:hypothetical protein
MIRHVVTASKPLSGLGKSLYLAHSQELPGNGKRESPPLRHTVPTILSPPNLIVSIPVLPGISRLSVAPLAQQRKRDTPTPVSKTVSLLPSGATHQDVVRVLELNSIGRPKRYWKMARAWLMTEIGH